MKRIVIVGATGFVGRALVLALQGRGHHIAVLARAPARASAVLPAGIDVVDFHDEEALNAAIDRADAVVNLAGESIAGRRWTRRRKQLLTASRVDVTRRLVAAIGTRRQPLPVLVSASATGWYGDRGDTTLDEAAAPGSGFAAELCQAWETAASAAHATRIVYARLGVVLGRGGGAFPALQRVFRFGLGGRLGDGQQWMPWIHLDDAVAAFVQLIEDARFVGPIAVTSPSPIRQRELAAAFGRALHRPAVLPAPRAVVALALGEASSMLLASQRVVPRVLTAAGFTFRFPTLDAALADLVTDDVSISRARDVRDDSAYLRARKPRYTLHAQTELAAPLAEVFAFFSSPHNLAALTPSELAFEIDGDPGPAIARDVVIDYRIRVAGIPMRWRTRIERWRPGSSFVDSQERGPYRAWWHEHRFFERDGKTVMEDIVHYAPPFGPLGAIANRLVVARMLRRIFGFRRQAIRLRFDSRDSVPRDDRASQRGEVRHRRSS